MSVSSVVISERIGLGGGEGESSGGFVRRGGANRGGSVGTGTDDGMIIGSLSLGPDITRMSLVLSALVLSGSKA